MIYAPQSDLVTEQNRRNLFSSVSGKLANSNGFWNGPRSPGNPKPTRNGAADDTAVAGFQALAPRGDAKKQQRIAALRVAVAGGVA